MIRATAVLFASILLVMASAGAMAAEPEEIAAGGAAGAAIGAVVGGPGGMFAGALIGSAAAANNSFPAYYYSAPAPRYGYRDDYAAQAWRAPVAPNIRRTTDCWLWIDWDGNGRCPYSPY